MTVEELYNMVSFCVERGDDNMSVWTAEDVKTIRDALALLKKQKQARWVTEYTLRHMFVKCGNCGTYQPRTWPYCPTCGAKMFKGEEDDN